MHAMGEGTERLSVARRLWSPPARFADRPTERRVTFLELFFDLVFVVVIHSSDGTRGPSVMVGRRIARVPLLLGLVVVDQRDAGHEPSPTRTQS